MGEQAPASKQSKLQIGSAKPELALPRIREDLKLYPGPAHRDGSPSWRILDPVRNAFFEIGWLEFELLVRWANHRDAQELIERVRAETPIAPTLGEVRDLIEFLTANQLLVPSAGLSREALPCCPPSSPRI